MESKSIPKLRFPEFTAEWEQQKLGEVCEFLNGDRSENYPAASDYLESGIPFIGSDALGDTEINMEKVRFISKDKYEAMKGIKIQEGDILYTLRGAGYGKNSLADFNGGTVASSLVGIRCDKENVVSVFLTQWFNSIEANKEKKQAVNGSTAQNISVDDMKKYLISLPVIGEQKKIGTYFYNLDHLITLHQRKCDSLKKLRDGIIQRILSRELRFKRADGTEFENWVTKELSEIFTERKVSQIITEDAPLLSFTIEQGVINPQDKKTNKRDFLIKDKDMKKFALTEVDDIIYNPANLKYGAIHRNKLMRGVVSPIYAIFYTKQNPEFMEYVVKNPTFIKNSMKYLEGTVIKLMTLKPRDFLKLKVEIPASLEEQKIIAEFFMKFDETIDAEQIRIKKWKELKQGLLQQMFV